MALEVSDLVNLSRLVMNRTDYQPLLWHFDWKGQDIIGYLSSIPYWRGNLPVFSYSSTKENVRAYLGYTNIGGEQVFFTDSCDDNKYMYAAVAETEDQPELIAGSLKNKRMLKDRPVSVKAKNLNSILRILIMMSDTTASPPLWHFEHAHRHILGLVAPFYDYYEANALPVFFYVESKENPPEPFIRYLSSSGREEISYAPYIYDMKYFYGRIVNVNNMPFYSAKTVQR